MEIKDSITNKVTRKLKDFKEFRDLICAIDDMEKMQWELPESLDSEDWARIEIDTSAYDAIRSATNVFSAYLPKWDVQPRGPEDGDKAEELEAWLDWQYRLIDRRSGSATWSLMKSAVGYDIYTARLDYLPHLYGDNPTKKQQRQLKRGSFALTPERPDNILWEGSSVDLEWVCVAENVLAADVAPYWRDYEDANISELEKIIEDDADARINYFDYEDYDERIVFFSQAMTLNDDITDIDAEKIFSEKNEKGFISWVISIGGEEYEKDPAYMINPIVAPLHRSGSWGNQNLHGSLLTSKVLRRWGLPDMITYSMDGEPKDIDSSGGADQIVIGQGEEVKPYQAQPIDPGIKELVEMGRSKMQGNIGISTLQNPEATGNTPFSTLNAQIQLALTSLEKPKRVAEQALTQLGILMFDWVEFDGGVVKGFRAKNSGTNPMATRGAQLDIGGEGFSTEALFINARILPNNPTDKLQRMNFAVIANQQLQQPMSELSESLDLGNAEANREKWMEEQLEIAALTNFIETQKLVSEAKVQAELAKTTGGGGGLSAPKGNGSQPTAPASQNMAQGNGFNSDGGVPNQQASPTDTREQLTGQDMSGREF